MNDFLTRLIDEESQLHDKCSKLGAFIGSDKFDTIDQVQKNLLLIQHSAMNTYLICLRQRLNALRTADDGSNPPHGPGTPP